MFSQRKTMFKKKSYVIELHKNDDDNNNNFKHVCIIAVFLLVKLLYLLIHLLNY